MIYIFLGPPGSGKGTQAKLLSKKLKIPVVSTGDIVRESFKKKTPDGIKAEKYLEKGRLVPNELIFKMLKEYLEEKNLGGEFILDGFPRKVVQVELLETFIREQQLVLKKVFHLDTSEKIVVDRIMGRREEESKKGKVRKDDRPELIKIRLQKYLRKIRPILKYYEKRGLLERVDNSPPIEEVHKEIMKRLS